MIRKKRHFRNFNLDDAADVNDYQDLLNNKLCTITEKEKVVETIKFYSDQGVLTRSEDEIHFLVHWEEKLI